MAFMRGICAALLISTTASVSTAPTAAADASDSLRTALVATRGASCGPLRPDPMVEQAAAGINESTNKWLDNASRAVPETDALAVLKDLGYPGSKAAILSGAGRTDAAAIETLLLQGYAKIPDCSYTDFGVNAIHNDSKGLILTTVVLAG